MSKDGAAVLSVCWSLIGYVFDQRLYVYLPPVSFYLIY